MDTQTRRRNPSSASRQRWLSRFFRWLFPSSFRLRDGLWQSFERDQSVWGASAPANDLERYFRANPGRLLHKWGHYFDIYDRHFSRFRGTDVHVVEFGVSHGGSLQMWRDYFGPQAKIYGVDINPLCAQFAGEGVEIYIGDQEDRRFLRSLAKNIPRIDILIDDGGHSMRQQIHTYEELFPHVDARGVYLCEDTHTSYQQSLGGGYRRRGSFIEYSKGLIDQINAWHSEQPGRLGVSAFTRSAGSIHFYDSVVVIEKHPRNKPYHLRTGLSTPGLSED